jgi:hypothetical protein
MKKLDTSAVDDRSRPDGPPDTRPDELGLFGNEG